MLEMIFGFLMGCLFCVGLASLERVEDWWVARSVEKDRATRTMEALEE